MSAPVATLRRKAFEDAILLLLYEHRESGGLGGEALLAAIIEESNDALARLRESGMVER